jgi:Cu/Ag efflux pump CusA
MIGGMISALLLTMLILPAIYLLWEWRHIQKSQI